MKRLGRFILVWESALAGVVFLAIAVTALFDPSLVKTVESLDCFIKAKIIAAYWLPSWKTDEIIVAASFISGAFNMAIVLASAIRTRR
ncbi:MAG: hypothetical protein PHD72_01485 [Patescibacteria group bacterium]|nr:hypothetical protein [Patescibacteria group bacterium]